MTWGHSPGQGEEGPGNPGPALGSLLLHLPSPELGVPASPSRSGDGREEPCPRSLKGTPSIRQCPLNYSEQGQQTFPMESQMVNIYTLWATRSPPLWTRLGLAGLVAGKQPLPSAKVGVGMC